MSDVYIGRQPIFDRKLRTFGYELLYRSSGASQSAGAAARGNGDQLTIDVILNAFMEIGLNQLVGDKKAFINLTQSFFADMYPIPFLPDQVVLEVLEDVSIDTKLAQSLSALSKQGYVLALDDVTSISPILPLLKYIHIIKMDVLGRPKEKIAADVSTLNKYNVKLLAEKVETQAEFTFLKHIGFDYFQGFFLSRPQTVSGRQIQQSQLTTMRLLSELGNPDMDFGKLETIISQDVSLSYKLLRLINSAHYGLRINVNSIRQALALLGTKRVLGWMMLIATTGRTNKPAELMRVAITRASMCDLLARHKSLGNRDTYFMVGLFSALDALLDKPMSQIVAAMPFSNEVKSALLYHKGSIGTVLKTVLAYERGNWEHARLSGLSTGAICDSYLQSIDFAAKMSDTLSDMK